MTDDATPDRAATPNVLPTRPALRMIAESIVNEAVDECLRTAAVKRTWGEIIVKALEDEGMLR
jgi:hypothetical protein